MSNIIYFFRRTVMFFDFEKTISHFGYKGEYVSFEEIKAGNINSTYKLVFNDNGKERVYILQRINNNVFRDPIGLMENVGNVTEHLRKKLDPNDPEKSRKVLRFTKTLDGEFVYHDEEDRYWRSYTYVENATAHNSIEDPVMFYEAGKGFGAFQRNLSDFPAEMLHETIPNFHNTKSRYNDFLEAVKADRAGRVKEVKEEIDFLVERRELMSRIVDMLETGELPLRVTHNDTKLNNILIDDLTKKAICVIDLDTIMPGSSLYDYGDAIRFGANTAAEDEPDVSKISVDMELFKLFTKGFVEEAAHNFDKNEIHYLPLGALVMTCELVMRFLTDYINGDTYFKIRYPEHNLVRTRAQMKLMCELEKKFDEMTEYVDSLIDG